MHFCNCLSIAKQVGDGLIDRVSKHSKHISLLNTIWDRKHFQNVWITQNAAIASHFTGVRCPNGKSFHHVPHNLQSYIQSYMIWLLEQIIQLVYLIWLHFYCKHGANEIKLAVKPTEVDHISIDIIEDWYYVSLIVAGIFVQLLLYTAVFTVRENVRFNVISFVNFCFVDTYF